MSAPAIAAETEDLPLDKLPDPLAASWHAGPFRLDPFFRLEELGYDSNIFLASRGQERSDFKTRFGPGIRGQALFGHTGSISFEERPEYVAYMRTSNQNYANNRLYGRADLILNQVSLFLGSRWILTRERPSDEFDNRPRVRSFEQLAGAGWRTSNRTSVSATIAHRNISFTDKDFPLIGQFLDRRERRVSLRASYRVFARTRVFAEYSLLNTSGARLERDARLLSWMPGLLFDPSARLSGSVKAGPGRLTSRDPDRAGFSGILGEANLALRLGESWRVQSLWTREALYSIFENNLFYVEKLLEGKIQRALGSWLAVEGGTRWIHLDWPGRNPDTCGTSLLDCSDLRHDRIRENFVGLRTRLSRRTDLSFRFTFRRRTSNYPGQQDQQTTFTTGTGF